MCAQEQTVLTSNFIPICPIRYYSEEASEGLEGYSDSSQGMPELEYRWRAVFLFAGLDFIC